ncbi:MAG: lipopolysaccharide assembly LapA domain-containing protein [Gammaproteobacteria bacterium]
MRIFNYIVLTIILLLGITFACLNAQTVGINLYLVKYQMPLSLLLVLTFVLGCLLGTLVCFATLLKEKGKTISLNHRLNIMEKELSNLRTSPLKDS